ncbi:hypothetical protein BDN72DRAFT_592341 [Pluteus cervinus]|uniref:Uncharacterized protein n=1 Tax=Pluteus cervinus TaxID=181527 RepID=A0ACD3AVV5_9AGAR|nr:hypothetical protein BDN72DRAFT_592341 [Pluteus cervinus]
MAFMYSDLFSLSSSPCPSSIVSENDAVEDSSITITSSLPPPSALFDTSVLHLTNGFNRLNVGLAYGDVADPTGLLYMPEAQDRTLPTYAAFFPPAHSPPTATSIGYINPNVLSSTGTQYFAGTEEDTTPYTYTGVVPPQTGTVTLVEQQGLQHAELRVTRKCTRPVGSSATRIAGRRRRRGVKRLYKCNIPGCDGELTSLTNLRGHIDAHYNRRKYPCQFFLCDKSFTYNHGRVRHQNTCRFRHNQGHN